MNLSVSPSAGDPEAESPAYRVRPAAVADSAEVARLAGELGYPAEPTEMSGRLAGLLRSENHIVAVAEGAHGLLGWIAAEQRLLLESGKRVEIVGLIVGDGARRRGVGKALVEAAEQWAAANGQASVFVRSNVVRTESHPFYERLGYKRTKTQHAYSKLLLNASECPS